jgi:hypothetical protein
MGDGYQKMKLNDFENNKIFDRQFQSLSGQRFILSMTLPQSAQSPIFDHRIEPEVVLTTFLPSESVNLNVFSLLSSSGLVDIINSFEASKKLSFDIILSTKSTFPQILILCFRLKSFLQVNGIYHFDFNSISKEEWNITSFDCICFVIGKSATDSDLFYSAISCPPAFLFFDFFMTGVAEYKIGWNERDFVEKSLKEENHQSFFDHENDFVVNEVNSFREFLKLSGGGQTSSGMKSNTSCEIEDSVEILDYNAFFNWNSLTKVIFRSPSI